MSLQGLAVEMAKQGTVVWNHMNLAQGVLGAVGDGVVTLYTATQRTIVDRIVLCETTGADTTITLRHVPSGAVSAATHNFVHPAAGTGEVGASDTLTIEGPFYLDPGDIIAGAAAAAARVNYFIYGRHNNPTE